MPVVEVHDLRRSYGSFEALRGISFSVEAGEIVGLLGPNGAGKTTAMKVLTGFLAPTSGMVRVGGHDVLTAPLEVRRLLGYLPENAPVYEDMRIGAYLDFAGRIRELGQAERAAAIARVVQATGLSDRVRQRIGTLSRGLRQRVGLAQALLHDPPLLILDEPTTGLDPNQIAEIRSLIRQLGRTRTVLLSTHILSEVQVTCDRVLILHQGQVVADARTEQLAAASSGQVLDVGVGTGKVQATPAELKAQLLALQGVHTVRPAAPGPSSVRFTVHADGDVREAVYGWAVARGHILLELHAQQTDLEDVFRRLTRDVGEAA